jgi:hypothetical protein
MEVNHGVSTLYKPAIFNDVCVTAIIGGMYEEARAA